MRHSQHHDPEKKDNLKDEFSNRIGGEGEVPFTPVLYDNESHVK